MCGAIVMDARRAAGRHRGDFGIWIEQTEGAKFWLRVVNELKTRGAQDILIAVVDQRTSRTARDLAHRQTHR